MLTQELMDALDMVKQAQGVLAVAPLIAGAFGLVVTSVCAIKIGKARWDR